MTAEGWIGLAALVVALLVFAVERLDSHRHGQSSTEQAAAIARLVAIEEARAAKEAEREAAAAEARRTEVELAAKVAAAEEEAARSADVTAKIRAQAANVRRAVWIVNRGPHAATVLSAPILNGPEDRPTVSQRWSELDDAVLQPGDERKVSTGMVGAGPARVVLRWLDGRDGEQSSTIEVEIPDAPAWPPR